MTEQSNLGAAIEAAYTAAINDGDGYVNFELVADYLRREWGAGISAADFQSGVKSLIPISQAQPGQVIRIYAGDTMILGTVNWQDKHNVFLKTHDSHGSISIPNHLYLCEVVE